MSDNLVRTLTRASILVYDSDGLTWWWMCPLHKDEAERYTPLNPRRTPMDGVRKAEGGVRELQGK